MKTFFMAVTVMLLLMQQSDAAPKKPKEVPPVLYLLSLKSYPDAKIEGDLVILVSPTGEKFGERHPGVQMGVEGGTFKSVGEDIYLAVPQGGHAKIYFDMTYRIEGGEVKKVNEKRHSIQWVFDGEKHAEFDVPMPGEKGFQTLIVVSNSADQWKKDYDAAVKAVNQQKKSKPSSASKK